MNFIKRLILAPFFAAGVITLAAVAATVATLIGAALTAGALAVIAVILVMTLLLQVRAVFTGKAVSESVDTLKTAVEGKLASA